MENFSHPQTEKVGLNIKYIFLCETHFYLSCNLQSFTQCTLHSPSNTELDIQYKKVFIKVVSRVAKQKLRTLGNREVSAKFQNWMERQPSVQSPYQKYSALAFKKYAKTSRFKTFWSCLKLFDFLIFPRVFPKGL